MSVTGIYLVLGAALFFLGTLGVLIRKNVIVILMCVELMLNAANLSFVSFAREVQDLSAQVFVLFVFAVAAAEAAVGLAIIIAAFRHYHSVKISEMDCLRG